MYRVVNFLYLWRAYPKFKNIEKKLKVILKMIAFPGVWLFFVPVVDGSKRD